MRFIKSRWQLVLLSLFIIVLIAVTGFLIFVSDYYVADNTAIAAISNNSAYTVSNSSDFIKFTPNHNKTNTGVILYPGGKVEAESYTILASQLAKNGYTSIIVRMPFNLAFFGSNKAADVIAQNPDIQNWVIGGHSLGGVFASDYAVNNPDKIDGVIYLASYPAANASNATFKALSIRGSLDNLTLPQDIENNRNKFPANTTFITIEGGNHFNFGNYGIQAGDNNSTISREQQLNLTVQYILEFLKSFK